MFEYTANNHVWWSVNGEQFAWHNGPDYQFDFGLGKVDPDKVGDFRTEVNRTVETIRASVSDQIFVTFSGGVDGEIICRGFMDCGYNVTPLTYVYPHGINEYDVWYARDFCRKSGLKGLEMPLDVMDFYHNHMPEYCDRYKLPHWICTWKAFLFDSFDGFMVQAQGWPQLILEDECLLVKEESHQMNPLVLSGRSGIGDFYRYRPELLYSWLVDTDVSRWAGLMHRPVESLSGERHFKFFALSKYYATDTYPLLPREKRSGLESIGPWVNEKIKATQRKYKTHVKTKAWTYHDYLKMMTA